MIVFHWAPVAKRNVILRVGLNPGSLSRNGQWRPPFVSYSVDPRWAIDAANLYHPITEPMDLWQVDVDATDLTFVEALSHGQDTPELEVRIYERVPAEHCHYVATREPAPTQTQTDGERPRAIAPGASHQAAIPNHLPTEPHQ